MTAAYGFSSPDELRKAVRGARQGGDTFREPPAPLNWAWNPIVQPVKVFVKVTGPKVDGDDRNYYPSEMHVRDLEAASVHLFWLGIQTDLEQVANECVTFTPNGEALRKNVMYEGKVMGYWKIPDPDWEFNPLDPDAEVPLIDISCVIVDCTDAVEIIRTTMLRNDDGDYQGFIQEFDSSTNSWIDGEEVWVRNAN